MAELSTLDGLFKEVYASEINNLIPEASHLSKVVPFAKSKQLGKEYVQPVIVSSVGGFTVGVNSQAYTLNASAGMVVEDARITAPSLVLRQAIPYGQLAESTSTAGAFANATRLTVEAMIEAVTKRNEINYLYGGTSIAEVEDSTNVDTTHTVVDVEAGSWSAGIWSGSETSTSLNFYDKDGVLVSSGADAVFLVDKVDVDNKQLTISGTATGIAALDTAIAAAKLASATCGVRYLGTAGVEALGLKAICQTSGTLFSIDNTQYSLFKGNDVSISSTLTVKKLLGAFTPAIGRGLAEETTVYINPKTWIDLVAALEDIRRVDNSYSSSNIEVGEEAIGIFTSAGKSKIVPHLFVKEADVFILPVKRLLRTGASDITFTLDGMEGKFFRQLENQAGFELRCFSSQAMFTAHPAKCTFGTIA